MNNIALPQEQEYVKWSEGAEILGLKRNAFFYLVESGQVAAEQGRASRDGRYSLKDIHTVKTKREQSKPRKPHKPYRKRLAPVIFDWLSPADIPAILKLDFLVYDEMYLAEMERYQQWSEKNPQLAMAAFDARSNRQEMLAYCAALPLPEEVILEVMAHKREEVSITAEEIQAYDRPGAYTLLGNSAVNHPDRPDLLYQILRRMTAFWLEQYPTRYVTRIYSQAVSEAGDRMIQHLFMSPRYDLAPDAYMLDLARPGAAKVIRWFQSQLAAKAPLPEELQHPYVPQPTIHVPIAHKAISRPSGEHTSSAEIEPLPVGYVAIVALQEQYNVPETTAARWTKKYRKVGNWRAADGHIIKNALDQDGLTRFLEKVNNRQQ